MFLLYFRLFTFSDLCWVRLSVFSVLFCLSVSVKWLAVKTASEMTYTLSSGALNSTPSSLLHALLLCTVQQSIDISCRSGPQQQTCSCGFAAVSPSGTVSVQFLNGTSAHNRPFQCRYLALSGHAWVMHRPRSAYYAGSANNSCS